MSARHTLPPGFHPAATNTGQGTQGNPFHGAVVPGSARNGKGYQYNEHSRVHTGQVAHYNGPSQVHIGVQHNTYYPLPLSNTAYDPSGTDGAHHDHPMETAVVPPSGLMPAEHLRQQPGGHPFAPFAPQQQQHGASLGRPNRLSDIGPIDQIAADAVSKCWQHLEAYDPAIAGIKEHVDHRVATPDDYALYNKINQQLIEQCNAERLRAQERMAMQADPIGKAANTQILSNHEALQVPSPTNLHQGNEWVQRPVLRATASDKKFINDMVDMAIRNGVEDGGHFADVIRGIALTATYYKTKFREENPEHSNPMVEGLIKWCLEHEIGRDEAQILIQSRATAIRKSATAILNRQKKRVGATGHLSLIEEALKESKKTEKLVLTKNAQTGVAPQAVQIPMRPGNPRRVSTLLPLAAETSQKELEPTKATQREEKDEQTQKYIRQTIETYVQGSVKSGGDMRLVTRDLTRASWYQPGSAPLSERHPPRRVVCELLKWGQGNGVRGDIIRAMIRQETAKIQ
ncbi:hypothetical protein BU16DRAFT_542534 [Lophium mytilinum]|uniref:Uncharacterized protein n=1 Tax=Lophium mytilinum TaxID=390894 RepID=A0A6A6QH25_9PEZI|nr:hypothetical protein BU16DRAFT_542534 [Lophium mytilinum]